MSDPFYITLASSLAIHLGENLLDATTRRVREKFSGDEQKRALTIALREGLENALASFHFENVDQDHFSTLFERFIKKQEVVDEFTQLIDPRPNTVLNIEILRVKFNESGFDDKTLSIFTFDAFIHKFGEAFYDSASKQPVLQGVIEIGLLRETIEHLYKIESFTKRSAIANEHTATKADEINQTLEKFLRGQTQITEINIAIEQATSRGFEQVYVLLEKMISAVQKSGFDINISDVNNGNIIIGDGNKASNSASYQSVIALQTELTRLYESINGHQPSQEDLKIIEDRYRDHIIRWFQYLTFQGMMRTAQAISLPLEDVYVELRAVGEVPEEADTFSVEERRLLLEIDEKDEKAKQELMRHMDALRRERWSKTKIERKSIAETLLDKNQKSFVILGDPGSGKSTLLHLLALVYAKGQDSIQKYFNVPEQELNRLPIFVPLAAFDDMLKTNKGMTLLEFLPKYFDRRRLIPGLAPLFQQALESGNALVLFDGLDEVIDSTTRQYVANQVATMMNYYTQRGARFVMTSRFVGYREAPISGKIPHLSVLDFGDEEIKKFVHQWAHTYEKWAGGGIETSESIRLAHKLEKDLLEDVGSISSVKRLAANPLMLTMLALLRRQVGKLPHRRIELYKRYMDTMIDNWVEARSHGERESALEIFDPHQAESLLIPLAYWLQSTQPSGTASKSTIHKALVEICLRDEGFDPEAAPRHQYKLAEDRSYKFLDDMRNMSGLIVERGNDAYGFLHLTFQEYFAGRALAQMKTEDRWREIFPNLHNPRWQEPILLCAGQLGIVEKRRSDVSDLVKSIISHEDETEEILHRNLLLALSIAGDDVNLEPALIQEIVNSAVDNLPTTVYSFASELIDRLGQLVANGSVEGEFCLSKIWLTNDNFLIASAIKSLSEYLENEYIKNKVLNYINSNNYELKKSAISSLSHRLRFDNMVKAEFIKQIENPQLPDSLLIDYLGELAISDQTLQNVLINKLRDYQKINQVPDIKSLLNSVGKFLEGNAEAKMVASSLLGHENSDIRSEAINVLSKVMKIDNEIKNKITEMIDDPSLTVQFSAIENIYKNNVISKEGLWDIVSKKFGESPFLLIVLAQGLNIKSKAELIFSANPIDIPEDFYPIALSNIEQSDLTENEAETLLNLLESEKKTEIKSAIIKVFSSPSSFFTINQKFINILRGLISDKDWDLRRKIFEEVGKSLLIFTDFQERLNLLETGLRNKSTKESLSQFKYINQYLYSVLDKEPRSQSLLLSYLNSNNNDIKKAAVEALTTFPTNNSAIKESYILALDVIGLDAESAQLIKTHFNDDALVKNWFLKNILSDNIILAALSIYLLRDVLLKDDDLLNQALKQLNTNKHWAIIISILYVLSERSEKNEDIFDILFHFLKHTNPYIKLLAITSMPDQMLIEENVFFEVTQILESVDIDNSFIIDEVLTSSSNFADFFLITKFEEDFLDSDIIYELISKKIANLITHPRIEDFIIHQIYRAQSKLGNIIPKHLVDKDWFIQKHKESFLLHLSEDSSDIQLRMMTVLQKLINSEEIIRSEAIKLASSPDSGIRGYSIYALGSNSNNDIEVQKVLIGCLEDTNYLVRRSAIYALENTAYNLDLIKEKFTQSLHDKEASVRYASAEVLIKKFAATDAEIRNQVLYLIDDNDWSVRHNILRYFISSISSNIVLTEELRNNLIENLIDYVFSEEDFDFYDLINNEDIWTLLKKHLPNEKLFQKISNDSWRVRIRAAIILTKKNEFSIDNLLNLAENDSGLESYPARLESASYLINYNTHSKDAIQLCLDALEYGTGKWEFRIGQEVRKQAALTLSVLEPIHYDQRVYDQLRKAMTTDEDKQVRDTAYTALVKLVRAKEFK